MNMPKLRTRLLIACIGTGAILAAAPHAKADDTTTFITDARSLGFTNSPETLLRNGYAVCESLHNGSNGTQIAQYLYLNTDYTVSYEEAALFVLAAVTSLCPEFDNRGQAVA